MQHAIDIQGDYTHLYAVYERDTKEKLASCRAGQAGRCAAENVEKRGEKKGT